MSTKLLVEVINENGVWENLTEDVKTAVIELGLTSPRGNTPKKGKCDLVMENTSKQYSTISTGEIIDCGRRLRVRAGTNLSGYAMQSMLDGMSGINGDIDVTTSGTKTPFFDDPAFGTSGKIKFAQQVYIDKPGVLSKIAMTVTIQGGTTLSVKFCKTNIDNTAPDEDSVLYSGTYTSAQAAALTAGTAINGPYLPPGYIWVVAKGTSDSKWTGSASASTYANGKAMYSPDDGLTWLDFGGKAGSVTFTNSQGVYDFDMTLTTAAAGATYIYQTVSQSIANTDVLLLTFKVRAQFGTQKNGGYAKIVTSAESSAVTIFEADTEWSTITVSFTATTIATTVEPRLFAAYEGDGTTLTALEYKDITLTKNGGVNLISNGTFSNGTTSGWSVMRSDGSENYSETNKDTDAFLKRLSLANQVVISTSATTIPVGESGGLQVAAGQRFSVGANFWAYKFKFTLGANTGTPTGTMTWELYLFGATPTGSVLMTGTFTPVPSALNEITVPTNMQLINGWFVLKSTNAQSAGNRWNWNASTTDVFASNMRATYNGTTWTANASGFDLDLTVNGSSTIVDQYLAQDVVIKNPAQINKISLYLAKVGAPTGTLTLRVETIGGSNTPSGILVAASATTTVLASTLSTSYGLIDFVFATPFLVDVGTTVSLVLSTSDGVSSTDYVKWGYKGTGATVEGTFWQYASQNQGEGYTYGQANVASSESAYYVYHDCIVTISAIPNYHILFNGVIDNIFPDAHDASAKECSIECVDFVDYLQRQDIALALQIDRNANQINSTLLNLIPRTSLYAPLTSENQGPGLQKFNRVFDGYEQNETSVFEAMRDLAQSSYGRFWVDRDGTFRYRDRDFIPDRLNSDDALILTDGIGNIKLSVQRRRDMVVNKSTIIYHPRTTDSNISVLGTSPINVQVTADGTEVAHTVEFKDASGNTIGGYNVTDPVAGTDYIITDAGGATLTSPVTGLTVTTDVQASQCVFTFTNTSARVLYIKNIQVRGYAVTTYDPVKVTYKEVADGELERVIKRDLPLSNSAAFAESLGKYLVHQFKNPFTEVSKIETTYLTQIGSVDLLGLELCDVVKITDAQSRLSNLRHMLCNVKYVISKEAIDYVEAIEWEVERIDQNDYWVLGDNAKGLLGQTNRLGI